MDNGLSQLLRLRSSHKLFLLLRVIMTLHLGRVASVVRLSAAETLCLSCSSNALGCEKLLSLP